MAFDDGNKEEKFHNVSPDRLERIKAAIAGKFPKFANTPENTMVKVRFGVSLSWRYEGTDLVVTFDTMFLKEAKSTLIEFVNGIQ